MCVSVCHRAEPADDELLEVAPRVHLAIGSRKRTREREREREREERTETDRRAARLWNAAQDAAC